MTVNSSVRSNATNFMSQLQTGVDPRTGQFTVNLKLPDVQPHDRRGPALQIALAYSALTPLDAGYGLGWDVPLSQLRLSSRILTTHGGETFKITSDPGLLGRMTVGQQKIESFHLYRDSTTVCRLVHRTGEVEFLEERGSGEFRAAVPVQICTPQGHRLNLEYETFGGHPRLASVRQADGESLLEIKREANALILSLNPYMGDGPSARYMLHLDAEGKVTRVELPTDEKAAWTFSYRKVKELWCIEEMRTPSSGLERLRYDDGGHKFPTSANRPALPRVTQHLRYPGGDRAHLDVRYHYCMDAEKPDERNFLGYGLPYSWPDDGLDYLYQHKEDYHYGTLETFWVTDASGTERPARSITRHFNRFHLQVLEETTQANAVARKVITYNLHDTADFDNQPATCQLPIQTTESWWRKDASSNVRSEIETRTYDSQGNLLVLTRPDGVKEISQYYAATGEDSEEGVCPANPEGFVTCLKKQETVPAPGAGKAPTLIKRMNYRTLPALQDPARSDLANWHTLSSEKSLELQGSEELELTSKVYTYVNDPELPFLHGRVVMAVTTRDFLPTVVAHEFSQIRAEDTPANVPVVQIRETLTGWDGQRSVNLTQESALTGDMLLREDGEGVQVRYEHDALGRPLREILAPEVAEDRGENSWVYHLAGSGSSEAPGLSATSLGGVTTRTYLDGLGRLVGEARDHVNDEVPTRLYDTLELRYDGLGQVIEQIEYDWYKGERHALSTRFEYDDWGERCRTVGPDGVIHHEYVDPVGNREHAGPILRSWRSSAEAISGMSEAWMNLFQRPDQVRALDASGELQWTRSFTYDGLGRAQSETDEYRNTSSFTYDALGRLISTRLPDSTIIEHRYAAHSEAELISEVALLPGGDRQKRAVLGAQTFDSLDRPTQMDVGLQHHRYSYEGGSNRPKRYTTAAGAQVDLDYRINLTGAPVASTAPDERCTYDYDPRNANLIRATNEDGERTYAYNASSQLIREHWRGKDDVLWTTEYDYSLRGRVQLRKDPTQAETVYRYDPLGRVSGMTCEQVAVTYEYDGFSRLDSVTTTDQASGVEQVTRYRYDDQDREIQRSTEVTGQPTRTLVQTWHEGQRLKSRDLTEGSTLLLGETFTYDNRGRLSIHTCEGSELPRDDLGRPVSKEVFGYDPFDNITVVTTTIENKVYRARYTARSDDPCQLDSITYVPARATGNLAFSYDPNGNLLNDDSGRRLVYDTQNRLLSVSDTADQLLSEYRYDANGALYAVKPEAQEASLLFFEGDRLSLAIAAADKRRVLYSGDQPLAQQTVGEPEQTLLLQTNASHSVIAEYHLGQLRHITYGAFGVAQEDDAEPRKGLLRFNGELAETVLGWYLLGRGFRVYNERIRRFHSPDTLTVLDGGPINRYGFVGNDPINFRDPSGHDSLNAHGRLRSPAEDLLPASDNGGGSNLDMWLMLGFGVITTLAAIFSASVALAALPAAMAAATITTGMVVKATVLTMSALTATAALGMQIYSSVANDEKIGRISFYLGMAGAVPGLLAGGWAGMRRGYQVVKRWFGTPAARTSVALPSPLRIPRPRLLSRANSASTEPINTNMTSVSAPRTSPSPAAQVGGAGIPPPPPLPSASSATVTNLTQATATSSTTTVGVDAATAGGAGAIQSSTNPNVTFKLRQPYFSNMGWRAYDGGSWPIVGEGTAQRIRSAMGISK